ITKKSAASSVGLGAQLKAWWKRVAGFDRKGAVGTGGLFAISVLGVLLYASSSRELVRDLQTAGFAAAQAESIARCSAREPAWFLLFFGLAIGTVIIVMSGTFSRERASWAGALLALVLVADLARANRPWIVYYDYLERYASNPVLDIIRKEPFEHRVAARL